MAITDESNGMVMPVAPMYGGGNNGFGFGNDWGWIILLLLFAGGGWGNGFGGGFNNSLGYDFPWLLNGQNAINGNTNAGFQNAMLNDGITSIRDGINGLSTQICNCCSDSQIAMLNGFNGVEQGANTRQIANMQGMFNLQSQLADCCCENRLGIANLGSTIISENCADRQALNEGVRDIIANQTASTQRILDQLCADKIDAKNEKIVELQNQLNMASLRESQIAQNAFISQGFANEVDALYNRLSNCPVPSVPVYGKTNIFSCSNGCGCGCNNF